ncbi:MAG: hypothetical protein HOH48_06765 [Candidatus Puniceispirillum sp.]|jgi:uncharacterized protein|uniref:Mth938-like domain-containing protein n=1 Tax=Candidatus Puniceispirillum sp. TaxID=2026719 RepID=UPI001EC17F5D|nr:hypothetical protein [Candidatus Puniceispirillum sp.]MBT6415788.1 hypothetical protein [Candidatus Puniceispirillum sp.]MBT6566558.1 hypothetical protein [Candidatus Puniceispirillum sp.]
MVDIKTFTEKSDLQLIHGYGDNGFRISGSRYSGDVMVLPRMTLAWSPPDLNNISFDDLAPLLGDIPPPLFILGVGQAPMQLYPDLAAYLKIKNISLEVMSTAAACRTWNVLMSEGRDAAAGLIAVDA